MRIALVCPYSLSYPGGAQSQVLGLARWFERLGHEVVVIAPTDEEETAGRAPGGLPTALIATGPSIGLAANGSVARIAPWPAAWARTWAALRDGRFDVVHVHEPLVPGPSLAASLATWLPSGRLGLSGQRRLGGPRRNGATVGRPRTVATFHRSGAGAAYIVAGRAASPLLGRVDAFTAVSMAAASTARRATGMRALVVPNGVDAERFAGALPWPKQRPTIVFVGRHEERKGLEDLLAAFELIGPGTQLWVIGEGPLSTRLQRRYAGMAGLEWLGTVPDDELARRLAAADVACFPSHGGESFGVVLLEAMAAGCAVVASDIPGYRAAAGDAAMYSAPRGSSSLAASLEMVLKDASLRARLVSAGSRVVQETTMESVARRFLAVYGSAAHGRTAYGRRR
ncbi:MAG: glycosyltransferase family 4 protein [Acidimicrobiales bacterium]